MKKYFLFLVVYFLFCSDIARSVERERVATRFCGGDFEPSPQTVHRFKNGLLFCHQDEHFGQELFFSFGINSGTKLIADLSPGPSSSRPRGFFEINDSVFFVADTPEHGLSLWSLTNINTKPKLIFAGISEHEPESSSNNTDFRLFGEVNGEVFFRAAHEAVKTDGTPEGTSLLGVAGSRLIGDSLYFITGNISGDRTLSASQAAAGANPVLNRVDAAGNMFVVKELGGLVAYFSEFTLMGKAMIYSDFSFATEKEGTLQGTFDPILFLTDGTTEGTDVAPQNFGGIRFMPPEGQVGNTLFFTQTTLEIVDGSREITMKLVSTTDGIVETEIQELEPNLDLTLSASTYRTTIFPSGGVTSISDGVSSYGIPILFEGGGSDIFFQNKMIGKCFDDNSSVCASQGTTASFEKIATFDTSFIPSLRSFAQTPLGVYFEGPEGELWITDGSAPGTRLVKDFGDNTSLLLRASRRAGFTVSEGQLGEKLFFQIRTGDDQKTEIWVTDGSEAGTFRVRYFYDDGTPREVTTDQSRWIPSILDLLLGE